MLQYWFMITNRYSRASYLEVWYLIELQCFKGWFSFPDRHRPPLCTQKEEISILGYNVWCIVCNGTLLLLSQHGLFWYEFNISNILSVMLYSKDWYTLGTAAVQWLIPISGIHLPPLLNFTYQKGRDVKIHSISIGHALMLTYNV